MSDRVQYVLQESWHPVQSVAAGGSSVIMNITGFFFKEERAHRVGKEAKSEKDQKGRKNVKTI